MMFSAILSYDADILWPIFRFLKAANETSGVPVKLGKVQASSDPHKIINDCVSRS